MSICILISILFIPLCNMLSTTLFTHSQNRTNKNMKSICVFLILVCAVSLTVSQEEPLNYEEGKNIEWFNIHCNNHILPANIWSHFIFCVPECCLLDRRYSIVRSTWSHVLFSSLFSLFVLPWFIYTHRRTFYYFEIFLLLEMKSLVDFYEHELPKNGGGGGKEIWIQPWAIVTTCVTTCMHVLCMDTDIVIETKPRAKNRCHPWSYWVQYVFTLQIKITI